MLKNFASGKNQSDFIAGGSGLNLLSLPFSMAYSHISH